MSNHKDSFNAGWAEKIKEYNDKRKRIFPRLRDEEDVAEINKLNDRIKILEEKLNACKKIGE